MKEMNRKEFLKLAVKGTAAAAVLSALPSTLTAYADEGEKLYIPGTYSAEAPGKEKVIVTMTFDETKITDVQVDVSAETPEIGGIHGETLRAQLLEKQSADIDGVTGATMTSNGVKEAAANCIRQALGLEMDAISSAVIGGTLLTGGVGNVFGSFFGVLINGTISSIVKTNGKLASSWPNILTAILLFLPAFGNGDDSPATVSLFALTGVQAWAKFVFLIIIGITVLNGLFGMILIHFDRPVWNRHRLYTGMALSILGVAIFIAVRQPYAGILYFALLVIKTLGILKLR